MKLAVAWVALAALVFACLCVKEMPTAANPGGEMNLEGKRIAMIIAHEGFRDEEFEKPYEMFTRGGASVEIVSTDLSEATGMLGKKVKPTMLIDNLSVDQFDAVVFVGGAGSQVYFDDARALSIAREANEKNKIVAAICIAPVILANAGVLEGRRATVWDGEFIKKLESKGAIYTGNDVERDGNVITANGPHAAERFAAEIARALTE